jgi:hypothetical protein
MAKLIYARIIEGFPQQLYQSISYAPGYSKRGLVLTTPETDDVVLIDAYDKMNLSEPTELAVLNSLGIGPKPENVRIVDFSPFKSWKENAYKNKNTIDWLKKKEFESFVVFTGKSQCVHHLSKELNISLMSSNLETSIWAEAKQTFQFFNKKHQLGPEGYTCKNNGEIIEAWSHLSSKKGFTGLGVVKASQSASGVVSSIVSTKQELEGFLKEFDFSKLDGGVLEEWVSSDPSSPSINYDVFSTGKVKEAFISNQIFEDSAIRYGKEGTRIYRGNRYPTTFSESIQKEIREKSRVYLDELISNGYWGPVGFDTIVIPNNPKGSQVMVTEINPRLTGPRFAHEPMKLLGAKGAFCVNNEKVCKKYSPEDIVKQLKPIMFSPKTKSGFLFFNFFPGKFTGIILAKSEDELDSKVEEISPYLEALS